MTSVSYPHNIMDQRYQLNHTGRDTYIWDNNGGFSNVNHVEARTERNRMNQTTQMLPQYHRRLSPKLASAHDTQRPIFYKVEGTGRDTYIQHNNGGLTSPTASCMRDPRLIFSSNLRNYERDDAYLARRRPSM